MKKKKKTKKKILVQGLKISTRRIQLDTTIGTYRWMCRFGGGECRVVSHTRYEN